MPRIQQKPDNTHASASIHTPGPTLDLADVAVFTSYEAAARAVETRAMAMPEAMLTTTPQIADQIAEPMWCPLAEMTRPMNAMTAVRRC